MNEVVGANREAYRVQGAAVLRGVLPFEWIERMRAAVDRVIAQPAATALEYTGTGKSGRYVGDYFMWMRDPDFEALALDSPLPALAAELMGSTTARLFYDHLLVKEPGTAEETPWHQDLPYWPVRGSQVLSLWVPLDPVSVETGAVHYLPGSHADGKMYAPASFSSNSDFAALYQKGGLPPLPRDEIEAAFDRLLSWPTEPGDVVVHHPLTLHYAPGNSSLDVRRRAIALRYVGDDAVYDARPGTFVEKDVVRDALLEPLDFADGEPLGGRNFPAAWPKREAAAPASA